MAGHKRPSAIYDDLFDEEGWMDFKSSSDLHRSIDQIKYERQKVSRGRWLRPQLIEIRHRQIKNGH